jgi:hypothetical protein
MQQWEKYPDSSIDPEEMRYNTKQKKMSFR